MLLHEHMEELLIGEINLWIKSYHFSFAENELKYHILLFAISSLSILCKPEMVYAYHFSATWMHVFQAALTQTVMLRLLSSREPLHSAARLSEARWYLK